MQLLVGLGNPGARYVGTRHNFGFEAVERLAREMGASWEAAMALSRVARGTLEGRSVLLAEPLTYMNRSGRALNELLRWTGCAPSDVLVFYDDVALPLGSIRIRERGTSGGHLGLQSILDGLENDQLARVRLGIRPEIEPPDLAAFVLEPFTVAEREVVGRVLDRTVEATRTVLKEGIVKAMSIYNQAPT